MKSHKLSQISGVASIILSSMGLILALIILPLIKVLPEATGLPIFIVLFPGMIAFAFVGAVLGGMGLTGGQKKKHLWGMITGSLALVINVIVIIAA